MQVLRHPTKGWLPLMLFAGCGLLAGTIAWLWATYGLSVYIAQAANFAMTCF